MPRREHAGNRESSRKRTREDEGLADIGYERPSNAREHRIARDNRAERVRLTLRASSEQHGYYVFDELMTEEAGRLDFLAVGPLGVVAVVMRDDEGIVSVTQDGELLLDSRPFDDDPRAQVEELGKDVVARVDNADGLVATLICFSRAEVEYPENLELMRGVCKVWTLSWTLDPKDQEQLSPADVAELADEVERVYGRQPFARPAGTGP